MAEQTPDRSEMWQALKWTIILLVALIVSVGIYKAWHIATAPARVVTNAAESVKDGASAVFNRLEVPLAKQRAFDRAANSAFAHLNNLSETEPGDVKARGFRMTNLRGAQNRVCETSYDFGAGAVPVYVAADNAAHQAAKTVGSDADRLIRIVIVSPEQTLGLNMAYDEITDKWSLGWRPSSINKPYPDTWAEKPITNILKRIARACS